MGQIHGENMGSPAAIVDEGGRLYVNTILDKVKFRGSGIVVFPKHHDRLIMGKAFQAGSYIQNMPLDTSGGILLCPCDTADLHLGFDARTDGDAVFEFYENTHVSDSGTVLQISNLNRYVATKPGSEMGCVLFVDPTIDTIGTMIHSAMFLGGSGVSTKFISASVSTADQVTEWILSAGSCYYMQFINICGRDMNADFNLVMHEHSLNLR